MEPLVDALLRAPVGVALLAALEGEVRATPSWLELLDRSEPTAVAEAVDLVATTSWAGLLGLAVRTGERAIGPWVVGGMDEVAKAYRWAPRRRSIAEAVVARFGPRLEQDVDLAAQEWWWSDRPEAALGPHLGDLRIVYGNGELTIGAVRTVTSPPPGIADDLIGAWEVFPTPVHRWRTPVRPDARVWEVHRPSDWARLVERYPARATRPHGGRELPGPNQHAAELAELMATPGQHAARTEIGGHVLPDWEAVATEWDGVHLSWAGFLTTEGFVSDVGDSVTMLRYWGSERTLWLADVFVEPEPLD